MSQQPLVTNSHTHCAACGQQLTHNAAVTANAPTVVGPVSSSPDSTDDSKQQQEQQQEQQEQRPQEEREQRNASDEQQHSRSSNNSSSSSSSNNNNSNSGKRRGRKRRYGDPGRWECFGDDSPNFGTYDMAEGLRRILRVPVGELGNEVQRLQEQPRISTTIIARFIRWMSTGGAINDCHSKE
jgi:DNA mismatch repair ATPase MutL